MSRFGAWISSVFNREEAGPSEFKRELDREVERASGLAAQIPGMTNAEMVAFIRKSEAEIPDLKILRVWDDVVSSELRLRTLLALSSVD